MIMKDKNVEKRVLITGGTGFIGRELCRLLPGEGFSPVVLSRGLTRGPQRGFGAAGESVKFVEWDGRSVGGWMKELDGAFAIINIAGSNIGEGRWNEGVRKKILNSRIEAGMAVLEALERVKAKPRVIIQGSALGYYAGKGDALISEGGESGGGFLAGVVKRWEKTTMDAASMGIRHVVARSGLVIGRGSLLLNRLETPMKLFFGGPLGSGRQWVSWIHLEDEARAMLYLLENDNLRGVFNLTSPVPVRNAVLMKALGRAIGRPSWFRVPAHLLRVALGEMADELILSGMRVIPSRLLAAGFEFRYPEIDTAMKRIYRAV